MKNKKKIISCICLIPLICFISFMYMFFIKTETIRITWMPVVDAQDVINQYIQVGYCSSGYISADKSYAEVEVTEWQRRKWLNYLYDDIGGYIERANQINYMNIKVSSDTKSLTVSADREVSFETLATYLGIIS